MKKALPFIAGALLLVAVAIVFIINKPQRKFDGRVTLNPTQKIPYATYTAFQLLQKSFPKANVKVSRDAPGDWKWKTKDSSGHVLLVVIDYFNPTADELNLITSFAQRGNFVFISALQMNERAQQYFGVSERNVYLLSSDVPPKQGIRLLDSFTVKLNDTVFTKPTRFTYPGISYDNIFTSYDDRFTYVLGENAKGKPNLLAEQTIKGAVFLHSAPITFSNLFLLYGDNHFYFEKLMSLFPADVKDVFWDEYFMYHQSTKSDDKSGFLSVLLKYKNFRWAFWLSLIVLALYTLTEIKRKQRYSPEPKKPANETLSFVSTIGKLYYEKGDHKNLGDKLSLYFLDFIRNKYNFNMSVYEPDFNEMLSLKSGYSSEKIREITDLLLNIKNSETITQEQLVDYYKKLEQFYRNV